MNSKLTNYIESQCELNDHKKYSKSTVPLLGYQLNLKDHEITGQAMSKLKKSKPWALNYGNALEVEQRWPHAMLEEKELILELVAPWGGNKKNTWGYITSGGTEGNMAAIKFALRKFQPAKPILLVSTETHFSIDKSLDLCQHSFQAYVKVPTFVNGQMNFNLISGRIKELIKTEEGITPVVVIATLGTTMKGASDDILMIRRTLLELGVERDKVFIHADAALNGGFWHLDKTNYPYKLGEDFNSLSISGHKWCGADVCGLFAIHHNDLARKTDDYKEILKIPDLTIAGSRNGYSTISWKVRLLQLDWQEEYDTCLLLVKWAELRFKEIGIETLINPASLMICFPCPSTKVLESYCLATDMDVHLGAIAHVIIMPHVTEQILEKFFSDILQNISGMRKKFYNPTKRLLGLVYKHIPDRCSIFSIFSM